MRREESSEGGRCWGLSTGKKGRGGRRDTLDCPSKCKARMFRGGALAGTAC
jgi:hypothetical protein